MKRAIVTGASGMIGATLIQRLIDRGIEVLAVIRPNSSKAGNVPESSLVTTVECELSHLKDFPFESVRYRQYDVFYHFAWNGASGAARNDTALQTENIKNALDALELAKRFGCTAFVGAGSQAEYGRTDQKLGAGTPVNPENGYGIAKYAAGKLCSLHASQLGIRFNWVRILSVFGPMDNDNAVITSTMDKLLKNQPLRFTKGDQVWDFIFSQDAAEALYLIGVFGKDGEVYPLGSGQPRLLRDYLTKLCQIVNTTVPVSFGDIPYNKDQVMYLCADIKQLTKDTGFYPKISFEEGVLITMKWLKKKIAL